MRISKDDLPIAVQTDGYVGSYEEMGEYLFAFESCVSGYSMDPLVSIFPDKACPVEHWGFVFTGRVRVEYVDGTEEIFNAGDAFWVPPGHRPYMLADTQLLQVSRTSEHEALRRKFVEAGLFPGGEEDRR
jgi:hypothetical protein